MSNYDEQMEAILAQSKPAEKPKTQDKKFSKDVLMTKYFNPMVDKAKGQTSATFKFRILPTSDGTSPFQEIKVHTGLKVGGKWQKFICLSEFGLECPLCETEEGLRKQGDKEEAKKYRASAFYVVKGIERGKEEEGVKFWRFKKKYDGQGAFDKIATLITLFGNILKPDTGYDLTITCTLDNKGYSTISAINCVLPSPLSTDEQQAAAWLADDATWKDVYSAKTPEYLTDVVNGVAAYWDDATKKFVNPAQLAKTQADQEAAMSGTAPASADSVEANPLLSNADFSGEEVNDDDLPF